MKRISQSVGGSLQHSYELYFCKTLCIRICMNFYSFVKYRKQSLHFIYLYISIVSFEAIE